MENPNFWCKAYQPLESLTNGDTSEGKTAGRDAPLSREYLKARQNAIDAVDLELGSTMSTEDSALVTGFSDYPKYEKSIKLFLYSLQYGMPVSIFEVSALHFENLWYSIAHCIPMRDTPKHSEDRDLTRCSNAGEIIDPTKIESLGVSLGLPRDSR